MTSEPRASDRPLAVVSILQVIGAITSIVLGYIYDSEKMSPGILTIAGLALLSGPAFWIAFRRAAGAISRGDE